MAVGPAVPDVPGVDQITGTSFRIHATANTISNGDGGASLKTMQFLAGLSSTYVWVLSPSFSNMSSEQYMTVTQVRDSSGNTVAVKPNTTYYIADILINSANYANQSANRTIKTTIAPMDKPTSTTPTNITSNSMLYNMDSDTSNNSNGSPLDNAEVQWSTSSSFSPLVGDVTYVVTGLTYEVTGLNPGTTYYFRGRTHNAAGWSNWSNTVSAKTLAVLPSAPSAPSITSVNSTYVYASFSNPYDGGSAILEKQIGYSTSSSGVQLTAAGDSWVGSLSRFTTYYFWARVRNSVGWGPWSGYTSVRTLADAPATPVLQSVGNATTNSFNMYFTTGDNGGDPSVVYQVGYGTDPNNVQYTTIAPSSGYETVGGLNRNTTYYVWVRAYNTNATSNWSARFSIATLPDYPSAPSSVVFTNLLQSSVHIAFSLGPDNGGAPITTQQVAYGTDPNNASTYITYTGEMDITNLTPGVTYYFWARAANSRGFGDWSPRVQITTLSGSMVRVSGAWKNAVPYVKVWGLWVRAQPYIRVNGVWKKTY